MLIGRDEDMQFSGPAVTPNTVPVSRLLCEPQVSGPGSDLGKVKLCVAAQLLEHRYGNYFINSHDLKQRGITEEEAWSQAYLECAKNVITKLNARASTAALNNVGSMKPGDVLLYPHETIVAAQLFRDGQATSLAMFVPAVLEAFARILKCSNALTTMPLMLATLGDSSTPNTFRIYSQYGEQFPIATSLTTDRRGSLVPYPASARQHRKIREAEKLVGFLVHTSLEHELGAVATYPKCWECTTTPAASQKLLLCGRCKYARFCNAQCQKANWPTHKAFCSEYAEQHRKRR
ncbi:hypothetical protein WJX73_004422 [Symbiochloris irregularis]|uniref:MYND-type domain-containing protein n=1 Tax=Symbiochloris irregularis TaxID=706552 RepID=A0AAW1NYI9_9CHLO